MAPKMHVLQAWLSEPLGDEVCMEGVIGDMASEQVLGTWPLPVSFFPWPS